MKIYKLSKKEFLETFKKVPRIAISITVINGQGKMLLTKRKEDPLRDYWHLPGSYILKNESIRNCIKRIMEEELGFKENFSSEFAFVSEDLDKDPRGHLVELIYKIKIADESMLKAVGRTKDLNFFSKIPPRVGFNHVEVLTRLGLGYNMSI